MPYTQDQIRQKAFALEKAGATSEEIEMFVKSASQTLPQRQSPSRYSVSNPRMGLNVAKDVATGVAGLFGSTAKQAIQYPQTLIGSAARLPSDIESYVTGKPVEQTRLRKFGERVMQPTNVPLLGNVKPLSASPDDFGIAQTPAETLAQGATSYLELGAPGLGRAIKKPITKIAEKLYQSALKPSEELLKKGVVQTALKERVWLTNGGVERAAQKIDDLESKLGDLFGKTETVNGVETFTPGTASGKTIPTKGVRDFVEPIKKWFETVDTDASLGAQEYIQKTLKNFETKYGKNIPIEKAQELKINTMRALRNSYGELTSVQKETQKQMARFLKEGIVEAAPVAGEINARLKNLYALDDALSKASRRIGNLNLLGLGTKIGAAAGGSKGAAIGAVADLMDKPFIKSGAAIGLNELQKLSGKAAMGARIPVVELLNYIQRNYGESSDDGTTRTKLPKQKQ